MPINKIGSNEYKNFLVVLSRLILRPSFSQVDRLGYLLDVDFFVSDVRWKLIFFVVVVVDVVFIDNQSHKKIIQPLPRKPISFLLQLEVKNSHEKKMLRSVDDVSFLKDNGTKFNFLIKVFVKFICVI